MSINKNALIRYNTIDNCLQNRQRLWTLDDLIDACSDALYEFEGIDKGVSKRTVQADIQMMRSEKLGYNAPIIVKERKYYTYEDPEYSITNIPLTDQDLKRLNEAVEILGQFKGFTHFQELNGMVHRLQDKIHSSKKDQRPIIDIEKNEQLKGLMFIDELYKAIQNKKCIEMTYQSFKARQEGTYVFHPLLLKEHRNRWFVLGKKKRSNPAMMLALDRISAIKTLEQDVMEIDEDYTKDFFKDVIGVSVNEGHEPEDILLLSTFENAPYIITKPLHHSQKVVERTKEGVVISLRVQHNFELERDILAFGDRVKVLEPHRLRQSIMNRIQESIDSYHTELNDSELKFYPNRLLHKGSITNNNIYTTKEIRKIGFALNNYRKGNQTEQNKDLYAIRRLMIEIPALAPLVLNTNLKKVIDSFGEGYFLSKALYFDKPAQSNWYVTWHQDIPINVNEKIETDGYSAWTKKGDTISVRPPVEVSHNIISIRIHLDDTTKENGALHVLPGSHKEIHSTETIRTIVDNSSADIVEVKAGGIHIMKPLLLHSSQKTINKKKRRVIHLEFTNQELPNGLEWGERLGIKNTLPQL